MSPESYQVAWREWVNTKYINSPRLALVLIDGEITQADDEIQIRIRVENLAQKLWIEEKIADELLSGFSSYCGGIRVKLSIKVEGNIFYINK